MVDDSDSEDEDDDEEDDEDEEDGFEQGDNEGQLIDTLSHVNPEQSFFSWDLLVKYLPKLPDVELFFKRDVIRHKDFFNKDNNTWRSLPPFLIVTKKPECEAPIDLNIGRINTYEGIPNTSELLQVYEDFHHGKYPIKEICLLSYKCKCPSTLLLSSRFCYSFHRCLLPKYNPRDRRSRPRPDFTASQRQPHS